MNDDATQGQRKRRGCFFYGFLVAAVLMLIIVVAAVLGVRYAKNLVQDFTDPEPMALPVVQMEPAELEKLQRRVERFRTAILRGESPEPLAVTADEINALIATDPDLAPFKNRLHVSVENDRLKALLSIPAREIGMEMLMDRYVNATGIFDIAMREDGTLRVIAQELSSKGKPLPETVMRRVRTHNLAQPLNDDPRAAAALERLQAIEVKEGRLLIVPKT